MAGLRNGRGAWYFVTVVVMAMAMAAVATVKSGGRLFGGVLGRGGRRTVSCVDLW